MLKKKGTIICLKSDAVKGELYIGEQNRLTTSITAAKVFNATAACRRTIAQQFCDKHSVFNFKTSEIERWSDDVI